MNITPVFSGTCKNGKFIAEFPEQLQAYLYSLEGKKICCTFKKRSKPQSDQQRGYYWGVVLPIISLYLGYETDEMHDIFKEKFLKVPCNSLIGYKIGSTSKLTTAEYSDFLSRVITFASTDLGCIIPSPGDVVC